MIVAELLMVIGLMGIVISVGYACFKLGEFIKRNKHD